MMTPEQAVVASILTCVAGSILTLLIARNKTAAGWLAFACAAATAVMIFMAAGQVLISGPSAQSATFWAIPEIGFALRIHVDGLTAVFLILAALIAVPAALYSIPYMKHYREYGVARYYPYFLLFLAAMYGLLSTTDMMWFFCIFWQMMTLPGYALIRFEHRKAGNIRAANKYLLMMQIACAATMIGAELLADSGVAAAGREGMKYDFETVSAVVASSLSAKPMVTTIAFLLFLVGFGIKMGMWPFGQVWLPDAHPAAPSPVSAMLSGVMIKTGVYGLMRYFLWLVPAEALSHYPVANWGVLVTLLGTITLFTGTMQALKQEQSKRLLAFHSIGQVGYILLGTGACMMLVARPEPLAASLATIAFFGALFHTLNHGLFKGLLFLNAGSILHATGTQDLNKLGGLLKPMPLTALTALVACFSISGVPLFNGFVSKWSIYVATVQGSSLIGWLAICAIIAILTSALTLASFIKFFGVSFLSRPSPLVESRVAERGRLEVGWLMGVPQVFLAGACILLGLAPAIGFRLMEHAMAASHSGLGAVLDNPDLPAGVAAFAVAPLASKAVYAPLALACALGLAFLFVRFVSKLGRASRRTAVPWLCGYGRELPAHRYVAHHFYGEFKRYFRWMGSSPAPPEVETKKIAPLNPGF